MTKKEDKKQEHWIQSKWRPAMGWMYMVVCFCDFVIFPILWSLLQLWDHDGVIDKQWNPITLSGAGLFHMAMGAVLGVAAWSRGQEKINGMSMNSNAPSSATNNPRPPIPPMPNKNDRPPIMNKNDMMNE